MNVNVPLAVLGSRLLDLGAKPDVCKKLLQQAVRFDSQLGFAWFHLAMAAGKAGLMEEALKAAEQAVLIDGSDGPAASMLAQLKTQTHFRIVADLHLLGLLSTEMTHLKMSSILLRLIRSRHYH